MKRCLKCAKSFISAKWSCPKCGHAPAMRSGHPIFAPDLEQTGAAYPSEGFASLAAIENENFWFRARNHLIVWALQRHFPRMERYMEIGCGTGYVLAGVAQAFPKTALVGAEIFSVGLSFAASRVAAAELIQLDARRIPYDEEFDVIGAFDVLEHIKEDQLVLAEILRAVRPGGGIILTVPQHPWLWSATDEYARHVRRYRRIELRQKVLDAGFVVELETSFVSLLLPALLASRLALNTSKSSVDATCVELRLPSLINKLLAIPMNIERVMIRAGIRFPAGGSALLVARKASGAAPFERDARL